MVTSADLAKVSADSHVDEPHDLWFERLDADLRDRAPRRIQSDRDGGWSLVINDNPLGWQDMSPEQAQAQELERVAAASADVRLDMMRTDHVNGEIIFPTIGLYVWNIDDPAVGSASCEIYNDWILERLGGIDRIKVAAMLPTWDVQMAIDEIERVGHHDSIGGLMLPLVGTPEWNLPAWEPLWDALEAVGKPAVMHQGSGHDMIFYRGWGSPTANLLATQSMAPRASALLSCSGVLDRHPDLHVVMVEVNAGWMAWTMSTLDEYYLAHQKNGWTKPILPELPSHYLRRQVHATFQTDPVAMHNIPLTGTDCLLWGNDYPHPESTYPDSAQVLDALLDGVSEADAHAVIYDNAVRIFGFGDAVSAPVDMTSVAANPSDEHSDSRRREAVERSLQSARERAERRTTRFVDAALELIRAHNGVEFTIQELLDRTKLSLHAFYQLFETKDDLIEVVLEESLARGADELRAGVDEHDQPLERLRAFVVGYVDMAHAGTAMLGLGPAFAELTVRLGITAPDKAWRAYRPVRVLAYEVLRAAIDDGALRTDLDPDVVAQFVLASVRSAAEMEVTGASTVHVSGEQVWQLLAPGLVAPTN